MLKNQLIRIAAIGFLCLLCSCSPKPLSSVHETDAWSPASAQPGSALDHPKSRLDFTLVNLSGVPLKAIYISPAQSSGWEENVIAGNSLADGDSVKIRFSADEPATAWDLRVVGANGRYSEWKGLDLAEIATVRLRVRGGAQPLAMIEAE